MNQINVVEDRQDVSAMQIVGVVCAILTTAVVHQFLSYVIKSELAWRRFKKHSRNLPMKSGRRLFGNHTLDQLDKDGTHALKEEHDRMGNPSTMGILWGDFCVASTTDLDLMESIVLKGAAVNKRSEIGLPMGTASKSLVFARDGEWKRLRGFVAPALRANIFKKSHILQEIQNATKNLTDHIDGKLDKMEHYEGQKSVNLQWDNLSLFCLIDLALSVIYKQPNRVDYDKGDQYVRIFQDSLKAAATNPIAKICIFFPPLMPLINRIVRWIPPYRAHMNAIDEFISKARQDAAEARSQLNANKQLMRQEREGDASRNTDKVQLSNGRIYERSIIDTLTDKLLDGQMREDEYSSSSNVLFTASVNTAAGALCHTLYLIALDQDVQQELRKSIETEGMYSELLGWAINESLRLLPHGLDGGSRTISEDIEIDGGKHVLPKGTFVMANTFIIHRLKQYWGDDADEFKPKRWRNASKHHAMQYLPFGIGRRACPGRDLALYELRYVITQLLLRYNLATDYRSDAHNFDSPFYWFTVPKSSTYIRFERLQ